MTQEAVSHMKNFHCKKKQSMSSDAHFPSAVVVRVLLRLRVKT